MKRMLVIVMVLVVLFAGAAYAVTLTGTPHGDVITGTKRGDQISSFGGNDKVYGKAGFDTINCGEDNTGNKPDQDFADGGFETKKQRQNHPNRSDTFINCETHIH